MEQLDGGANAAIAAAVDETGLPVIRISGELDISNVEMIEGQLAGLVDDASRPLTFDLSSLTFMDSSGLAMLLRTADENGPILIRQPTGAVRRIIQATGLGDVLRVEA